VTKRLELDDIMHVDDLCLLIICSFDCLVIDSFGELFDMTAPDFAPLYEAVRSLGDLPADATIASDSAITLG